MPDPDEDSGGRPLPAADGFDWPVVWTAVFVLNAAMPAWVGALACRAAADWAGLAGGLLLLWGAGLSVAVAGRPVRDAFLRGAVAVGLLQIVPCLPAFAVAAAAVVWHAVAGPAVPAGVGLFAVTVLTGGPLLAAMAAVGAAVTAWDARQDDIHFRRVYGDPPGPEGDP